MAACNVEGSFQKQFTRIYDYAHELLKSNPGSTVILKADSENGETIFQRFYVCLKACKNSFASCRPFIGLDGCFLKGKYKGEILTAVGRDPNKQMLPIAYAIVEKGLKETMAELLPGAEQRFCMRHLYANFRKKFRGQTLKNLMWKATTSYYPEAWEREMLKMKDVNVEAYKHLITLPPSVIVDARGKPIITMLEEIRVYIMKKWATNKIKMANMDFQICTKIKKRLAKESRLCKNWIPSWCGEKLFEVRHFAMVTNKYAVNLDTQDCTCRKWVVSGIPCCHAIATMTFLNLNPEDFVPIWFRRSTYDETYASIIFPVNGHLLWERTSYPDVLPPFRRKLPGRPKKKRRLES
ncbi:uncharacterized protein LOC106752445 [Vigna radiata var. radiata]|uniref:Uncharacterized protein LOC106752445 n=1 Tax=Vigna radiata var. radiata TaxID=3916 RepID=A0A3Q0EQZ0_VIGRR|nr:uncharacterized protein LOC106752445 [Vigna radiata var. radiata]